MISVDGSNSDIFAPESSSYVRGQEKNRQPRSKIHLLRSNRSKPLFDRGICTEQGMESKRFSAPPCSARDERHDAAVA